ncbi:MAG: hydrogenase nickel incorporation protein HypB [Acidobacteria bacterium]|nr:hydrogenase nickel incorporation protein HypB [Acidobacteriota bacterium]
MAEIRNIRVMEQILKANDYLASALNAEWDQTRTFVVNLMSSPGAGKTSLLEATLPLLKEEYRMLVLEGDIETERDAERIRTQGVPALQITTGGTCHLESHMIDQAWKLARDRGPFDLLFIENVGNLVCPASYFLGEHLTVVMLSTPEGDDKPMKYPKAFRSSQVFLISKSDLLYALDFSPERARREALQLQPKIETLLVSSKSGEGMQRWIQLLKQQRARRFGS